MKLDYYFASLLLQSPEQKLRWSRSLIYLFDVWQGLISILSMWSPPTSLMDELFNLSWWSTAGLAPSTSSTRSSLCSQSQPGTAWVMVTWCLRSSAHPSQAMASQRLRTRKVSDEEAPSELQDFWYNTSAIPQPPVHCSLWMQEGRLWVWGSVNLALHICWCDWCSMAGCGDLEGNGSWKPSLLSTFSSLHWIYIIMLGQTGLLCGVSLYIQALTPVQLLGYFTSWWRDWASRNTIFREETGDLVLLQTWPRCCQSE